MSSHAEVEKSHRFRPCLQVKITLMIIYWFFTEILCPVSVIIYKDSFLKETKCQGLTSIKNGPTQSYHETRTLSTQSLKTYPFNFWTKTSGQLQESSSSRKSGTQLSPRNNPAQSFYTTSAAIWYLPDVRVFFTRFTDEEDRNIIQHDVDYSYRTRIRRKQRHSKYGHWTSWKIRRWRKISITPLTSEVSSQHQGAEYWRRVLTSQQSSSWYHTA